MSRARRTAPAPPPERPHWYAVAGLATLALVSLVVLFAWPRGGGEQAPSIAAPGTAGQLEARSAQVNLGTVPFDLLQQASLELVNTGDRPVRLQGKPTVKTLEGC